MLLDSDSVKRDMLGLREESWAYGNVGEVSKKKNYFGLSFFRLVGYESDC